MRDALFYPTASDLARMLLIVAVSFLGATLGRAGGQAAGAWLMGPRRGVVSGTSERMGR